MFLEVDFLNSRNMLLFGFSMLAISACTYSIDDIDVASLQPECVRQCSISYSGCVAEGNAVGFKTETLRACRDGYSICTATCPES